MDINELNKKFNSNVLVTNYEVEPQGQNNLTLLINGEEIKLAFKSGYKLLKWLENLETERKFNPTLEPTNYSLKKTFQKNIDKWKTGYAFYPHKKVTWQEPLVNTILFDGCMNVIETFHFYQKRGDIARVGENYILGREVIYLGKYDPRPKVGLPNGSISLLGIERYYGEKYYHPYTGAFNFSEEPTEFPKVYLEEEDRFVWLNWDYRILPPNIPLSVAYRFVNCGGNTYLYKGIYGSTLYNFIY